MRASKVGIFCLVGEKNRFALSLLSVSKRRFCKLLKSGSGQKGLLFVGS